MEQENISQKSETYEWFQSTIVVTFIVTLLFLLFIGNFSLVSGTSMYPTLEHQDRVLVQIIGYDPSKNDIIITDSFIDYGMPLVKRIIATGGDVVEIDGETGEVSVNGEVLSEPYLEETTTFVGDITYPFTVPENTVFVMGDNRQGSSDSRLSSVGCIHENEIVGKVLLRVSPFEDFGLVN